MLYFSHLLPDEEMREMIQQTGMGVESIEFSIAENLDNLDEKLISYEKRLERMGCEKLILHGPFLDLNPMTYDSAVREVTRRRYEEAYIAARKLGAKKVIYHSCYVPQFYLTIGWAERTAAFFREFLADKDDSIEVVVENVLDLQPQFLCETAEQVVGKNFGLCLDLGHANCYSEKPVLQWVKEMDPFLSHVHVHDNFGERDIHLAMGAGSMPGKELFEQLLGGKRPRTYTIECASREKVCQSWQWICTNFPDLCDNPIVDKRKKDV